MRWALGLWMLIGIALPTNGQDVAPAIPGDVTAVATDRPPSPQLLAQFRILNVTLGEVSALGIDAGKGLTAMLDVPAGPAGNGQSAHVLRHDHPWFEALSAVERKGLVHVSAEPTLVALDGQQAQIEVGREIEVPAPTPENKNATRKEMLGIRASFLGHVTAPQTITCDVRLRLCELASEGGQPTAGGVPALRVREVSTGAVVRNGETLVLGGLKTAVKVKTGLLRQRDDQTELLVLVTTKLVEGPVTAGRPRGTVR